MNHYCALYRTPKGLAAQVGGVPVFPSRGFNHRLREGVVELVEGTLHEKPGYAFSDMRNVVGVLPFGYRRIEFHAGSGVPLQVWKGAFGGSLVVKERRRVGCCIKVFALDGSILLHEKERKEKERVNFQYTRLDAAIGVWEDITDTVLPSIYDSITSLNFDIDLATPSVVDLCMRIGRDCVYESTEGYLYLNGKYETMLLFADETQPTFCWLGKKMEWSGVRRSLGGVKNEYVG